MSAHIPHGSGGFMAPFIACPQLGMPLGNVYPSSTPSMPPQHNAIEICEALSPPAPNTDTISWDIRKHPSSATTTTRGRSGAVNMASHATVDVTDHISISCSADVARKMWPDGIQVEGSPVNIGCVLKAIHRYFQQEITEKEYEKIREMDSHKYPHLLNDARNERSKLLVQNKENILRVPLRRVDCLGKKCNFGGLKAEYLPDGSYCIVLHLTSKAPSFY